MQSHEDPHAGSWRQTYLSPSCVIPLNEALDGCNDQQADKDGSHEVTGFKPPWGAITRAWYHITTRKRKDSIPRDPKPTLAIDFSCGRVRTFASPSIATFPRGVAFRAVLFLVLLLRLSSSSICNTRIFSVVKFTWFQTPRARFGLNEREIKSRERENPII